MTIRVRAASDEEKEELGRLARSRTCLAWPIAVEATLAYSEAAHEVAVERVRTFFAAHLK
jgi:hypothetical protein